LTKFEIILLPAKPSCANSAESSPSVTTYPVWKIFTGTSYVKLHFRYAMATVATEPKGSFQAEKQAESQQRSVNDSGLPVDQEKAAPEADGQEESQQNSVNGAEPPVDQEKAAPDEPDFGPAPEGGTRAYVTNSECPISGQ
jgi:hypothetical protein